MSAHFADVLAQPRGDIRARRHPWALLGLWAWQTGIALFVGWPAAALARVSGGEGSTDDAALWKAGGHALLDALWHETHALAVLTRTATLALLASAFAGLLPLAALMAALAYRAPEGRRNAGFVRSARVGLGAFGAFGVLFVVLGFAQVAVVGVGVAGAEWIESILHSALGEAGAQQLEALVVAVFVLAASAILVTHDLARAAALCSRVGGWRALGLGVSWFRMAPAHLWWSWAWRTGTGTALVVGGAQVVGRLRTDNGWVALFCAALIHQGIVVSRVALRASWLACALRVAADTASEFSTQEASI